MRDKISFRIALSIFIIFLFVKNSSSQTKFLDSIQQVIKHYPKRDSMYLLYSHSYCKLGLMYQNEFYISNTLEAIEVARKLKKEQYITDLAGNLGAHYSFILKDQVKAVELYTVAVKALYAKRDKFLDQSIIDAELTIYLNIVLAYYSVGDYANAKQYLVKVKAGLGEIRDTKKQESFYADYYSHKGNISIAEKSYDSAYKYFHACADYASRNNMPQQVVGSWANLITVFTDRKQYDSAKLYAKNALRLARRINLYQALPVIYVNLGTTYYEAKEDSLAIKYTNYAIDTAKLIGDLSAEMEAKKTLIKVYERQGKFKDAYFLFDEYFNFKDSVNSDDQKSAVLRKELEFVNQRRTDSLKFQVKQAELLQRQQSLKAKAKLALLDLAIANEKTLRLQNELNAKLSLANANSSLEKVKNQQQKTVFAAKQNALRAKAVIAEKTNQRNTALFLSVFFVLAAGGIFWGYKKRKDLIEIKNEVAYKERIADTNMKLLRLQLNPHFIFNSLNSIADFIQKNNITEADNYLTKFAKLMRGTLESSEEKEIPLNEELDMIDLYIQLEARRLGNTISYEINVDQSVDKDNTLVPPLILQPFVENSIWHGLSDKKDGGKIAIDIKLEHSTLTITIDDNGIGRNLNNVKVTHKKSFGVSLTQERLALLNASKGVNSSIEFKELNPGTSVILKLPLILA